MVHSYSKNILDQQFVFTNSESVFSTFYHQNAQYLNILLIQLLLSISFFKNHFFTICVFVCEFSKQCKRCVFDTNCIIQSLKSNLVQIVHSVSINKNIRKVSIRKIIEKIKLEIPFLGFFPKKSAQRYALFVVVNSFYFRFSFL